MKVKSLLDFMPEEQRKKALEKAQRRLERKKANTQDISPELYYMVKLGKHFGWNAFLDAMRGYVTTIDANGKTIKEPFVIEEMMTIVEAADKVEYRRTIDQSSAMVTSIQSALSKNPVNTFKTGMADFIEKAKVE